MSKGNLWKFENTELPAYIKEGCFVKHCEICDIVHGHWSNAKDHYDGSRHQLKIKEIVQARAQNDKKCIKEYPKKNNKFDNYKYCPVCDIKFQKYGDWKAHLDGEEHANGAEIWKNN